MNLKLEIDTVIKLTGASKPQIKLHNDGYNSRAYVIDDGKYVVKFPKFNCVNYKTEAQFLNFINTQNTSINMQKVKHLSSDNRIIAFYGIKGTPLSMLKNLSLEQQNNIGKQLAIFIRQLHSLELTLPVKKLSHEIDNYKKTYLECADFFSKHLTIKEKSILDILVNEYIPKKRLGLGEKLVLCHGDIWDTNILIDASGKVGLIDCANATIADEATDFCLYNKTLRNLLLDHYRANDALRQKVEFKYASSVIASPKYVIELEGEAIATKTYLPLIKKVICKYQHFSI